MSRRPIRRALVSVYDKTGLAELAHALHHAGVEVVSTGSTAASVAATGVPVTRVEELTGAAEILDGRVKTLHPAVHARLLADTGRETHAAQLAEYGWEPFDLLVSNLYPFAEVVRSGADVDSCVEHIDIGGPAMVRAAAKNHATVAVVTSPAQYSEVLAALRDGGTTPAQRRRLAATAFADIAEYDLAVASWTAGVLAVADDDSEPVGTSQPAGAAEPADVPADWPAFVGAGARRAAVLRYGENPHQRAALYTDPAAPPGLAQARLLQGKEMSYNNYVDADAAWRSVHDFAEPCVAVVKHANPCGIAVGDDVAQAHRKAHACDPVSAFGGVIAVNQPVTGALAAQIAEIVTDVLVAPSYTDEALTTLARRKQLRVLAAPPWRAPAREQRQLSGGWLAQDTDLVDAPGDDPAGWQCVAGTPVSEETFADLAFAWRAARSVKSNAILLAADRATVGVGMGQVNRVDAARLAVTRAGPERAHGAVAASDAFFPFPDGLQVLADAGVAAVVQPGGSVRDEEVIAAAAEAGVVLYLTGTRHFYH